jgi:hypothetical protein
MPYRRLRNFFRGQDAIDGAALPQMQRLDPAFSYIKARNSVVATCESGPHGQCRVVSAAAD